MQKKKILINLITSDGKVTNPLLWKLEHYPDELFELTIFCNKTTRDAIENSNVKIRNLEFFDFPYGNQPKSKMEFMFECLWRNLVSILYVKKVAKNFDIVYSNSSVLDLVLFPFLVKIANKKIKWVTVFDNVVPFWDPGNKILRLLSWLFFRISLILIRRADIIFASTKDLMLFLTKRYDRQKLVQSNLGCDARSILASKYRKEYDFDGLYLGRINETKGIDDMLAVLSLVKKRYPKFRLAMVGKGDINTINKYKQKIDKLGLSNNVRMLGWVDEKTKYDLLRSAKTFWFLSKSECESFGIALLEAVCSGKPAFVYNLKQMKDIYRHNEIYLHNIGDVKSVADDVINVFDNKLFANKKGEKLLGKYLWKTVAEIEVGAIKKLK